MSPQKSSAALAFSRPSPGLLPPDSKGRPGKSAPLMDSFSKFSMVGVYETRKGLKFVHITSDRLEGRFTVLLFMDNRWPSDQVNRPPRLTHLEAEEWKEFSDRLDDFRQAGAQVLAGCGDHGPGQVMGVCTDSHVTVRSMMMNSPTLRVRRGRTGCALHCAGDQVPDHLGP